MPALSTRELCNLARFHHAIRTATRATELAAREIGVTPRQHQLLLGVAGLEGPVTIGGLADFLQLRHHSVVELVQRAAEAGLVKPIENPADRREVHVLLSAKAKKVLANLAADHRRELSGARRTLDLLDARA